MVVRDPNQFIQQLCNKIEIAKQNRKRYLVVGDVYFDCQYDTDYYANEISAYLQNKGYEIVWKHSGYAVQFEVAL